MAQAEEPKVLKKACPRCGDDLKRVYSQKRDRHYWFCQSAEEVCGKIYPDDDGKPVLKQIEREPVPDILCPECGAIMECVEGAKFGRFMSCSNSDCQCTIDLADQSQDPSPD
ncbi:MAG TPA: hypothetical protein VKA76_07945, partial [Gammaproteobacteria bacterium]|nr:hypothetical protein [Gammaproteobacteria bacterium]